MTTEYDTRTHINAAGLEVWTDDGKPVNQNTAFRCTIDGHKLDLAAFTRNAATGLRASKRLDADPARRSQLKNITHRQTNVYGKALGDPVPNWASMGGKKGKK